MLLLLLSLLLFLLFILYTFNLCSFQLHNTILSSSPSLFFPFYPHFSSSFHIFFIIFLFSIASFHPSFPIPILPYPLLPPILIATPPSIPPQDAYSFSSHPKDHKTSSIPPSFLQPALHPSSYVPHSRTRFPLKIPRSSALSRH